MKIIKIAFKQMKKKEQIILHKNLQSGKANVQ